MNDLEYRLIRLARRNRDGSKATQADRRRMASLFARTIYKLGFRVADERAVKPKHILAALEEWRKTADDGALLGHRCSATRSQISKVPSTVIVAVAGNTLIVAVAGFDGVPAAAGVNLIHAFAAIRARAYRW